MGWSAAGKLEKHADISERTFGVWLAERRAQALQLAEDVCFQECVVGFPSNEKIRAPLASTHTVVSLVTGPENMGWPTSRPRRFTAAINKSRQLFVKDLACCHL